MATPEHVHQQHQHQEPSTYEWHCQQFRYHFRNDELLHFGEQLPSPNMPVQYKNCPDGLCDLCGVQNGSRRWDIEGKFGMCHDCWQDI